MAFDSARAAKKMNAKKVSIIYRNAPHKMPARKVEVEEAIKDQIGIIYETKVIGAEISDNKIKNVKCIKTKFEDSKLLNISNSEFGIEAETIIFAIRINSRYRIITKARNFNRQ